MKKNLVRLTCTFAICLLSLKVAFGCATIIVTPLTSFDSSEYIFIGEVFAVAEPITSERFHGEAWGLKIRVKDSVNLPKSPASHFVVVPFDLASDCRDLGQSEKELLRFFPVGSEVRVIAKESKYAKRLMPDGNIRLEVLPDNLGLIARNYSDAGQTLTSVGSRFEYKEYEEINPCGISGNDRPDYEAKTSVPDFEFRKDLLRLKNASSENEKVEILERLLYFPGSYEYDDIVAQHVKDRKVKKRLSEERKAWMRIFLSKLVLSC